MNWISPGDRLPHDTLDACTLWLCLEGERVTEGGYRRFELDQSLDEGEFFNIERIVITKVAWWRPMRTGDPPPMPPKK